jgi:hypothetical protein
MSLLCAQSFPYTRDSTPATQGSARAAFLNQALWPTLTTIRIYFFPLPPANELQQMSWQAPILPPANPNLPGYNPKDFLDPLYDTLQNKVDPISLVKSVVEQRIAPLVGLTFTYTNDITQSDIRIIFGPQYGCSSVVGNTRSIRFADRQQPTMTYGWFDVATVIHEFCHALGMIHEHQNPQENPIQWNREAVYCYYRYTQGWDIEKINQNVINAYQLDQTNGSNYDEDSIMIYPFNKTLECRLCKPLDDTDSSQCPGRTLPTTLNDLEVKPIYKLSPTDIRWLQIMYPKDGKRDMTLIRNLDKEVTDSPNAPPPSGPSPPYVPPWLDQANLNQQASKIMDLLRKNFKPILFIALGIVIFYVLWSASQSGSGNSATARTYATRRQSTL